MSSSLPTVFIGVIGAGNVGKCFLEQLADLAVRRPKPALKLAYITTSKRALYHKDYSGIGIAGAAGQLATAAADAVQTPLGLPELAGYLAAAPGHAVLVDNTSAQFVAEAYPQFLKLGVSVVTPNKKAFTGDYALYADIFGAAAASGAKIYYEAACGAGLPVISTIRDLVDTGDQITRIEGIVSGTLSFLFNGFSPATSPDAASTDAAPPIRWSAEVSKAKALGYTEPDPRDDLNGMDVARKVTSLARLAGLPVASPAAFPVESLIPAELAAVASADEYLQRLPDFDAQMDAVKAKAAAEGKVVRYVGCVDVTAQKLSVGLQAFDRSHPFAALRGSDNIFSIYTRRYGANPLIIQGAGAGGQVTAMGVTSDLIKVLSQIA